MKLNKAQMHKRPTYETLVKDTILEPKDKIALPDRAATILRKTQQLSRYDDAEFLDLKKDTEKKHRTLDIFLLRFCGSADDALRCPF